VCSWVSCDVTAEHDVTAAERDVTVVGYYMCDDPIPYRTRVAGRSLTLAQFKRLVSKPGSFRSVRACTATCPTRGFCSACISYLFIYSFIYLFVGSLVVSVQKGLGSNRSRDTLE